MPQYKLVYFDARGTAEPVRLMFAFAGVEYEDYRVAKEDWPAIKGDQPFGHLPVLIVNGDKPLPESKAIYRYVARELGLYGANSWEAALIDVGVELMNELGVAFKFYFTEKDPTRREEAYKKLAEVLAPTTCAYLEKYLSNNNQGNGWFVGDKLSLVEILFWGLQEVLSKHISPNVFNEYPKLKGLVERIGNVPAIAEWLAKRPLTEF